MKSMNSGKSKWVCLLATALLAGCEVGPNYVTPHTPLSNSFDAPTATAPATTSAAAPVDLAHWWRSLNDAELDSLIDRAIASNLDLHIAVTRLQESRAQQYIVSGGTLPYLDASGAAARGSGNNSTKGRVGAPLNSAANTTGLKEITQVVGFDAGWEIDLFGKFRRELEAAAADSQAVAEARNAVLITLIADVARAYVDLRTAQLRLDIAQQNIAAGEQTLNVVQQRFGLGLTNELDVALARRQIASERATVAPLEEAITQAQHRLAVLLGQPPESLSDELKTSASLPEPATKVITGLPADLLQRRPDIRQAERSLAAENARIGVATADLFPRLVLTAGLGLQGQGLGRMPTTSSLIWSVGPAASLPLLDFGRIDSTIMLENLRTQELYYNYQRTVLGAVEEVDNAANGYAAQRDRMDQLDQAVDASKRAVTLATGRYDRGLIDFLNVLDAQRQMYELQDQNTVAEQTVVLDYISLYKALGGGWESYQDIPPLRKPLPAILEAGSQVISPPKNPIETEPATPAGKK